MPLFGWVAIGAAVLIILWFISVYNALVRLRALLEEAFSGMDIFMKKRYDLIPNLVETVKGYAAHESKTLEAVIDARSRAINAGSGSIPERVESERALSGAVSRLMAVVEQYPQLKADGQFLNLSEQLSAAEADIAEARKYYNGTVRQFNTKIASFPASVVAALGHFEKQPYFEMEDVSERHAPQVQF